MANEIKIVLKGDTSQATLAIKQVFSAVDKGARTSSTGVSSLGSKLLSLSKGAGAGLVVAFGFSKLKDGFVELTKAASSLNETVSKTEQVFEKDSDAVIEWSRTTTTSMGISQRASLDYASTIGSILGAMGVASDSTLKYSKDIVKLSSDLASFHDMSPDEIFDKLRAAVSGEFEPLKRLGIVINQQRLEQRALADGIHFTKGKMDAQTKATTALKLIMEDTAKAQGNFELTQDGMANKTRIVSAKFEDFAGTLGQKLLPVMDSLLDGAMSLLDVFSDLGKTDLEKLLDDLDEMGDKASDIRLKINIDIAEQEKDQIERDLEKFTRNNKDKLSAEYKLLFNEKDLDVIGAKIEELKNKTNDALITEGEITDEIADRKRLLEDLQRVLDKQHRTANIARDAEERKKAQDASGETARQIRGIEREILALEQQQGTNHRENLETRNEELDVARDYYRLLLQQAEKEETINKLKAKEEGPKPEPPGKKGGVDQAQIEAEQEILKKLKTQYTELADFEINTVAEATAKIVELRQEREAHTKAFLDKHLGEVEAIKAREIDIERQAAEQKKAIEEDLSNQNVMTVEDELISKIELREKEKKDLEARTAFIKDLKDSELEVLIDHFEMRKELSLDFHEFEEDLLKAAHEAEQERLSERWEKRLEYSDQVAGLLTQTFALQDQIRRDDINNEIEETQIVFDQQRERVRAELNAGRITRTEYRKRMDEIDSNEKKRTQTLQRELKKQGMEYKAAQVAQAIINGIQAGMKTWAEWGFPFGIPLVAAQAAITTLQISKIQGTKFEEGGILRPEQGPGFFEAREPELISPVRTARPILEDLAAQIVAMFGPAVDNIVRVNQTTRFVGIDELLQRRNEMLELFREENNIPDDRQLTDEERDLFRNSVREIENRIAIWNSRPYDEPQRISQKRQQIESELQRQIAEGREIRERFSRKDADYDAAGRMEQLVNGLPGAMRNAFQNATFFFDFDREEMSVQLNQGQLARETGRYGN